MNYIHNLGGPFYLYVSKGNSVLTDYFIHTLSSQSPVYFEKIWSFAPRFALGCMLILVPWVCSGSGCNTVFLQFLACPKISGAVSVCLRSHSRVICCFLWSRVDSLYLPILEGLQTLKYKKYTIILCPYIVSLKTQFAYRRYLFCLFMEILW